MNPRELTTRRQHLQQLALLTGATLVGWRTASAEVTNSCYTARQYIGPGEQSVAGLLPVSTKGLNQNGPGVGFWVDPGIGAAWRSFSSPTNGTLVVMPEGSPTNEDGSPAASRCSATSGSKSGTESFEWLVDIPSDDSAYGSVLAMPMGSYPSWVRLDVFAGQPVDFVLFGRIGNPFAVRTRFSTGTMIVKQPSQVVRVETGGTAFLASYNSSGV